ncbi:MAG: PAS domain S-box protein, partial [Thermoplasmatota archaeon]
RREGIPFIVFTGKGREAVAMEALNLGADRYLHKGGDPRSQYGILAQAISQVVQHAEAEIALRESEEKYRNLFNDAPIGIIQYDEEGIIKECNDKFNDFMASSKDILME